MASNDNFESSGSEMMVDEEELKESQQLLDEEGQKSTQGQSNETCKVCYSADADAAFIPCGHVTACIRCA